MNEIINTFYQYSYFPCVRYWALPAAGKFAVCEEVSMGVIGGYLPKGVICLKALLVVICLKALLVVIYVENGVKQYEIQLKQNKLEILNRMAKELNLYDAVNQAKA